MHDPISNDEISKLDLSKVAALQQKRTLAFVNHFVVTTVQFLNNFMKRCDQKLMNFERKLEKVEASMVLLEARLSSIPEVNTVQVENKPQEGTTTNPNLSSIPEVNTVQVENKPQEGTTTNPNVNPQDTNSDSTETQDTNTKDEGDAKESMVTKEVIPPEYERFIKMVQVGVPLQAVKLKAGIEGLDTDHLEKFLNK